MLVSNHSLTWATLLSATLSAAAGCVSAGNPHPSEPLLPAPSASTLTATSSAIARSKRQAPLTVSALIPPLIQAGRPPVLNVRIDANDTLKIDIVIDEMDGSTHKPVKSFAPQTITANPGEDSRIRLNGPDDGFKGGNVYYRISLRKHGDDENLWTGSFQMDDRHLSGRTRP